MKKKIIVSICLIASLALVGCKDSTDSKNSKVESTEVSSYSIDEDVLKLVRDEFSDFDPSKTQEDYIRIFEELEPELDKYKEGMDIGEDSVITEFEYQVGNVIDSYSTILDPNPGIYVKMVCNSEKLDMKNFEFDKSVFYPITEMLLGEGSYIYAINAEIDSNINHDDYPSTVKWNCNDIYVKYEKEYGQIYMEIYLY